jgi:Mrp family chromosome partitioning ATPase
VAADDGYAVHYTELKPGTPVRSSDGQDVGVVAEVLDNAREHIFDGIVIDTPDGRRFVDAPEVARIFERAVVLTITAEQAKELHEQGSAVSARLRNTSTARRAKRLGRSMRDRWDQR